MSATPTDAVVVRTDATIHSGNTATIEIGEDVGATGTVDTSVFIDLQNGRDEHDIGDFEGGSGNDYFIWHDTFETTNREQTPQIHAIHIDIISREAVGELYAQVNGDALTIPLYAPEDIDDSRFRTRTPDGAVLSPALVSTSESPLHCRTPDGTVHGVQISNRESTSMSGYSINYGDSYGE